MEPLEKTSQTQAPPPPEGQPIVGSVLYGLSLFFTALVFAYTWAEFWMGGRAVFKTTFNGAYLVILGAYALEKEYRRWSSPSKQGPQATPRSRKGQWFVVGWWVFYALAGVLSNHWSRFAMPKDLFSLCVQVTGIFFGSQASKMALARRRGRPSAPEEEAGKEEAVLAYLSSHPGSSSEEIQDALGVSRAQLYRVLDGLIAQGRLAKSKEEGGRVVRYTLEGQGKRVS